MKVYAAVLETRGYIVGDSNVNSGLHIWEAGEWAQLGWPNIRCFGVSVQDNDILMAAGNGVLHSANDGHTWKITTGWEITEVLDIARSPADPSVVIAATAHGLWRSSDKLRSWHRLTREAEQVFAQTVVYSQVNNDLVVAGTERGVLISENGGRTFERVPGHFENGFAIRQIVEDGLMRGRFWAATEREGLVVSSHFGRSWTQAVEATGPLYAIAADEQRIAACGFHCGPIVTTDNGSTWQHYPFPDPTTSGHALLFSTTDTSKLWVGTTEDGVLILNLQTGDWTPAGLGESTIRGLYAG